jgi:dephospho-CoA kinase
VIIGLVGGVASGKSFVAQKLAALTSGMVIEADAIAKAMLTDATVLRALKDKFGDGIVGADGQVNRKAVASRVFGDTTSHAENRQWLNNLIHPKVRTEIQSQIAARRAESPNAWIILDIPLLLEGGWDKICDRVLFVDTSPELRAKFAAKRGWSADELAKREQSQISIQQKRVRATDHVLNSGVESELESGLGDWLSKL